MNLETELIGKREDFALLKNKLTSKNIYSYILIGFCIGIFSALMSFGLSGNDFWWHITAGEWMVDNKAFPKYDMFSWNAMSQNLKWTAHEWLAEVIYYFIFNIGGEIGIFIFCAISGSVLLLLLFHVCKDKMQNNMIFAILFFFFLTALFKLNIYGRPHLFSYFLLFAELKVLYDFANDKSSKSIYWIPVIGIIWANVHGGSSNLAYVLCIFFIVTHLFDFKFGKVEFKRFSKEKLLKLCGVTIASLAGICINPYGFSMLLYPYSNMADQLMLDLISEWASPDAKDISTLLFFFVPFALGLISIITTEKKIKAVDLLIFAFFSYLFFRSGRFIIFLMISLPFYAFDYIPEFGNLKELTTKSEKVMSMTLLGIAAGVTVYGFANGVFTYKNGVLISHELDNEFIEQIKEDTPKRLYNDYDYGGDLIYNGVKVYVDGRADVYTGMPLADFYNVTVLTRHSASADEYDNTTFVEDILVKYNFDAFLIGRGRPLCQYLHLHPEKYKLIKQNEDTAYYKVIE